MLHINFFPESNKKEYIVATEEYQQVWCNDKEKIVQSWQKFTNLSFVEDEINAVIYEGPSHSHPLTLRASYTADIKKATLIHELGHRLIAGNNVDIKTPDSSSRSLLNHKQLFLILYDLWAELYGNEFADKNVEVERSRTPMYKEAWAWALSIDKAQRKELFYKSMNGSL